MILIISIILLSGATLFLNFYRYQPVLEPGSQVQNDLTPEPADKIIYSEDLQLKVNGEEINSRDVDKQYQMIPPELKGNTTKNQVLQTILTQKLLLQEASRKEISATDEEINNYLTQVKAINGLDDNELLQQISKSGYTLDEYRLSIKDLLTESKLLDRELNLKNVQASDADVNSYIRKNKDEFQDVFDEGDQGLETILEKRVKQKLTREKQQALVNDYIQSLKQGAKID